MAVSYAVSPSCARSNSRAMSRSAAKPQSRKDSTKALTLSSSSSPTPADVWADVAGAIPAKEADAAAGEVADANIESTSGTGSEGSDAKVVWGSGNAPQE